MSIEKMREKVRQVKKNFPWYGQLYHADDLQSIEDLPFMTPDILEQNYYSKLYFSDLMVFQTSGTSSYQRKKIYYSQEDDQRYIDLKIRLFDFLMQGKGHKKAIVDVGTGHAASTACQIFNHLQLENKAISFHAPIEEHITEIKAFRPDVLYTMPSILDHLLLACNSPQELGIKQIILVGEVAPREWQQKIAQSFGIRKENIVDTLGSIEVGTIAYFSHEHDRYIIVDEMIAEGVKPDGIPAVKAWDGEGLRADESILVLTSFIRDWFPCLRFVTCDVVRDFRIERINGELKQTFHSIVKRIGPELKHGEKISLYDIEEVVFQYFDEAIVKVLMQHNNLLVTIQSKRWDEHIAKKIQKDIQSKIPEIGIMVKNKILDEILVQHVNVNESLDMNRIKHKKIYYE